jgi:hypothetical protein
VNVVDVSDTPGTGVQVVIGLYPEENTSRRSIIGPRDREWPRFAAAAKRVATDLGLRPGLIFSRADVQPTFGKGVEVQFSYKEE